MRATPDVTLFVGCCLSCGWQIQAGQKARSELGGAVETYNAMALANHEHQTSDHGEFKPDEHFAKGTGTLSDGAPVTGALMMVPLPRWWVEKS